MKIFCPRCRSKNIIKKTILRSGKRQYFCKDCGRYFTEDVAVLIEQTRFPKEFIALILYKKHQVPFPIMEPEVFANHLLPKLPYKNKKLKITGKIINIWDREYWTEIKENIAKEQASYHVSNLLSKYGKLFDDLPIRKDPLDIYAKELQKQNISLAMNEKIDYGVTLFNVFISMRISHKPLNFKRIQKGLRNDIEINSVVSIAPPYNMELRLKRNRMKNICMWLYGTGNATLLGARNLQEAEEFICKITEKLNEVYPRIIILKPEIKVDNICAKAKLAPIFTLESIESSIKLEKELAEVLNEEIELIKKAPSHKEKEGNIKSITRDKISYVFKNSGIKIDFLKNGEIIVRSAKKPEDIYTVVKQISELFYLKPFIYHSAD